jgi:hypothetical protein
MRFVLTGRRLLWGLDCRYFKATVTAAGSFLGLQYTAVHMFRVYSFQFHPPL